MLQNYFKIALRTLRRQPGYAFINLGGLALGLTCSFLIILFVRHELSYDDFHTNADRIHRVLLESETQRQAFTSASYAPRLEAMYPEIEAAIRMDFRGSYLRVGNDLLSLGQQLLFTDAVFLEAFDFPMLQGNAATALAAPRSIVLTESGARSLFGRTDVVGEVIGYANQFDLTVTGLVADPPANSHLRFGALVSFPTMTDLMGADALEDDTNYNYQTYVLLKPGVSLGALRQKLPAYGIHHYGEENGRQRWVALQPLAEIHTTTDVRWDYGTNVDPNYLLGFGLIGLFILVIACVNFTNLATARATGRAKEVGVRKSIGAQRGQLIAQFLGESVVMSAGAVLLALGLVVALLPWFNDLIGTQASFDWANLGVLGLLVVIGLGAGVLAGSYPAFYLSAFRPARVLKGDAGGSRRAAALRKGLIVLQFSIAVFLIIATLTVYNQLRYVQSKELGFDKEQVVFVSGRALGDNFEAFEQELLQHPAFLQVSKSVHVPGRAFTSQTYNWPGAEEEEGKSISALIIDPDYVETMGLTILEGRNLSWDRPTDVTQAYLVNEALVRDMGWADPIGQPFRVWSNEEMGEVVGVVQDFHFKSLHQTIEPVVMRMEPSWGGLAVVRFAGGDVGGMLATLETTFKKFAPGYPFRYTFLDQDFERLYQEEQEMGQLFGVFAGLAIFLACLGLFGLAAFAAAQRTKEIGVRKVLGASVLNLVGLLSKDFLVLVGVAFVVAAPLAYFAMTTWLSAFAYHISLGVGTFVLALFLAVAIAFLTVGFQALRASTVNPVQALRYE